MTVLQRQALDILRKNPWVQNAGGGTNDSPQNNGFLFAIFKDDPKRPLGPRSSPRCRSNSQPFPV